MKTRPAATDTGSDSDLRAILDAFRNIIRAIRLSARDSESQVGLSAAQLFVLHNLADGRVLSLGEIARRTSTDPSSVSVVVSRLVESGLVSRVRAPDDARRLEIGITAAGRRLLKSAPAAPQAQLIEALSAITPRNRALLAKCLTTVATKMGATSEPAQMLFEDEAAPRARRSTTVRHAVRSR